MTRCGAASAAVLRALAIAGALAGVTAAMAAPDRTPAQWLQAIEQAAQTQQYSGVYVYTTGDTMHALRVTHACQGGVVIERVQPLDGQLREYLRHGDDVQSLFPDQRRVVIEQSRGGAGFPSLGSAAPDEILNHYALELAGTERVAGVSCQVIHLRPRDGARYGYDLCVDPVGGLMLKVQTHDELGAVVEQLAFTAVRIGDPIDPAALHPSWSTSGWARVQRAARPVDFARLGWSMTMPAGFRRQQEVLRHLGDEPASGTAPAAPRQTLQAVLSDGLATVSVFIESGLVSSMPLDVAQRHGPASAFVRRVGDATVTVIGEVPSATVAAIANSVEFHDPH